MKLICNTFLILFLSLHCLLAQRTVLSGKVINPRDTVVRLLYFNPFEGTDTLSKLNRKQEFKLVLDLANPIYLRIKHANKYTDFFVSPKDSVYMTFDPRDMEGSFTVNGTNTAHYLYWKASTIFNKSYKKPSFDLTPEEDAKFTAELYQSKLAFLKKYQAENPKVSKAFVRFWELEYQYRPLNVKLIYPEVYAMNHKMDQADVNLPENYYAFLDTAIINKNQDWISFEYKNFLERVVMFNYHRLKQIAGREDKDNHIEIYQMGKILLTHKNKWYSLASLVDNGIAASEDSTAKALLYLFVKECPIPNICIKMKQRHRNLQKTAPKIVPAPNFAATDRNKKTVTLSELNGKVVLLHFWATGCTKNAMFENIVKLRKKYREDEVTFIDICLDDSEESWIESLSSLEENSGIHLYQNGGEYSDAAQNYNIKDCAAFFVIDKNGYFSGEQMLTPGMIELSNQIDIALGAKPQ
ncbi:MAG: TlpA family protein disulfide reductase [Bacteroidia bacterium]